MSAINDALRRASSAAKTPAPSSASPLPPMNVPATPPWLAHASPPPVPQPEPAPQLREIAAPPIIAPPLHDASDDAPVRKSSRLPLILGLVFLFCAGGAVAVYVFGTHRLLVSAREKLHTGKEKSADENNLAALADDNKSVAQPVNASVPGNQPVVRPPAVAQVTPQPAPKSNPPAPVPVAAPIAAIKPATTPHPPVHFPPLRLQSIFYRPGNASVMINGKTLFVGDEISGVAVADIQPSNVTLVLSGQTNILTLR